MKTHLKIITLSMIFAFPVGNVFAEMNMNHMSKDFERMDMMMDKAEKTKDNKKRHGIIEDHMEMMMKHMRDMHSMMGMDKMMSGKGKGNDMSSMSMMNKRMDNMQQVMNQMMRQQKIMMEYMSYND